MAQQPANVHFGTPPRNRFAARAIPTRLGRPLSALYAGQVLIVAGIVVVAVVLIVLAGRSSEANSGRDVRAVTATGLELAPEQESETDDDVVPWSSIFEITVLTRRELRATWFGFEIRTESHGMVLLDGSRGPGQQFLAESYRFAGFKHGELGEALEQRGARVVCYSR